MLLRDLESQCRSGTVNGWIHAYLLHYKHPFAPAIGSTLQALLEGYEGRVSSLVHWKRVAPWIFSEAAIERCADLLLTNEKGVFDTLADLRLSDDLGTGEFIGAVIERMVGDSRWLDVSEGLERVTSVLEVPNPPGKPKARSMDLVRIAASHILPRLAGAVSEADLDLAVPFFQRHLGDPRLAGGGVRWAGVSEEAISIFKQLTSKRDIAFFFDIVDRTAGEPKWPYRRSFWEAYIPHIENTWVVLGPKAFRLLNTAHSDEILRNREFGRLHGAGPEQSVFLIRLGGHTFVEWSHSGACRVWPLERTPFEFGHLKYHGTTLRRGGEVTKVIHHRAEYYRWQDQLASWIQRNLQITPTTSYRLEMKPRQRAR